MCSVHNKYGSNSTIAYISCDDGYTCNSFCYRYEEELGKCWIVYSRCADYANILPWIQSVFCYGSQSRLAL